MSYRITPDMIILDVVYNYQETLDVFRRYDELAGECICCNALFETLEGAASRYRFDLQVLIADLEEVAGLSGLPTES